MPSIEINKGNVKGLLQSKPITQVLSEPIKDKSPAEIMKQINDVMAQAKGIVDKVLDFKMQQQKDNSRVKNPPMADGEAIKNFTTKIEIDSEKLANFIFGFIGSLNNLDEEWKSKTVAQLINELNEKQEEYKQKLRALIILQEDKLKEALNVKKIPV